MTGGSAGLKVNKQNRRVPKVAAVLNQENALRNLTESSFNEMKNSWNSMSYKGYGETNYHQANGIVQDLIIQGLSNRAIKCVLNNIGNNRIDRIRKNPIQTPIPKKPHNAFSDDDIAHIKVFITRLEKEEGFTCPHRQPRQYLIKEGATKFSRWKIYVMVMQSNNFRVSSYERFTQYWEYFFPGLRSTRLKSDACDACVRIDITLADPSTFAEMRSELLIEKTMHLSAARNQRSAMNAAIKYSVMSWSDIEIPDNHIFVNDVIEAENDENILVKTQINDKTGHKSYNIRVQCEDFGQSIAMPHYAHIQPGVDFFNSNLMIHQFVVANTLTKTNLVYLYDERALKKDGDSMCNLRLINHLDLLQSYIRNNSPLPRIYISVMDNCFGQNK